MRNPIYPCILMLAVGAIVGGCEVADHTPPGAVTDFVATPGDQQVALSWTLPSDADFSSVKIQRKENTFPASATDGDTIYNGNGASFTDTGVTNGTLYRYAAFAYDTNNNFSSATRASAIPTSAQAQADILSAIADAQTLLETFGDGVLDTATKETLRAHLAGIDGIYRSGAICDTSNAVKEYLAALQDLYHGASLPAAEALYNSGRMIRYQMLSTASAKDLCPGEERVGQVAGAVLDQAHTDASQVRVTFNFGEPTVVTSLGNDEVFTLLKVPGVNAQAEDVGRPDVPVMTQLIAVPDGAEVVPEAVVEEAEVFRANLYPTQESPLAQSTLVQHAEPLPFTRDQDFYGRDILYPDKTVNATELGLAHGVRIFRVEAPAGQYNPATRTLRLFKKVDVKVTFAGGSSTFGDFSAQNLFEPIAAGMLQWVINGGVLGALQPKPFKGSESGEELMIITHRKFLTAANTLAEYKTKTGIITNVYVTSQAAVSGDIRYLIENHVQSTQMYPSYILLMGDVNYIPPFYFPNSAWFDQPASPCDFYYSTRYNALTYDYISSDWVVGRIPVNELSDADAAVNKIINYEKYPTDSADFYKHASICTDFECCWFVTSDQPAGREEQDFMQPCEKARKVLLNNGYNVDRIYTESIDAGDPAENRPAYNGKPAPHYYYDGTMLPSSLWLSGWNTYPEALTDTLKNAWNDGRIFIFYNSHGWCDGAGWWGVPFGLGDESGLTAQRPLPVVFSTTCDSGYYDMEVYTPTCNTDRHDPCFAEQLIRLDQRGAVSVIAAPRPTLISVNGQLTQAYARAIEWFGAGKVTMRLADIFLFGQGWISATCPHDEAVWHNHVYHIFGDPSLRIRLTKPVTVLGTIGSIVREVSGAMIVHYEGEDSMITAYSELDGKWLPVARGIVKNGVASMQRLTYREAAAVTYGTSLHLVVTHSDALPVTFDATVGRTGGK